jgi:hypothetical protein
VAARDGVGPRVVLGQRSRGIQLVEIVGHRWRDLVRR